MSWKIQYAVRPLRSDNTHFHIERTSTEKVARGKTGRVHRKRRTGIDVDSCCALLHHPVTQCCLVFGKMFFQLPTASRREPDATARNRGLIVHRRLIDFFHKYEPLKTQCCEDVRPSREVVCEADCSNRSWRIRALTEAPHKVLTCIKRGIFQRSIGALAGLHGPLPRDSLALGDKGHEYRINGPRSRPQGPHVWPHLRSLLCPTQVGLRTCGDGLNSARFTGQRTWSKYARPALNGNHAAPLQEFGMLPASTLSSMCK